MRSSSAYASSWSSRLGQIASPMIHQTPDGFFPILVPQSQGLPGFPDLNQWYMTVSPLTGLQSPLMTHREKETAPGLSSLNRWVVPRCSQKVAAAPRYVGGISQPWKEPVRRVQPRRGVSQVYIPVHVRRSLTSDPSRIRTCVSGLKGRCPWPARRWGHVSAPGVGPRRYPDVRVVPAPSDREQKLPCVPPRARELRSRTTTSGNCPSLSVSPHCGMP